MILQGAEEAGKQIPSGPKPAQDDKLKGLFGTTKSCPDARPLRIHSTPCVKAAL